jgi:hypothetical protein
MFQTRYVPFGLLSNKPLGTTSTMLWNRFGVNRKVKFSTQFSQFLFGLRINRLGAHGGGFAVDKPWTGAFVLIVL